MVASIQSNKFWRVSQAAKYLAVSTSQIRLLMKSGEIKGCRTAGNHRLVEVESLMEYCGEESLEESNGKIPVGIVARVSTNKAATGYSKGEESDLTRQLAKLKGYAANKWGDRAEITDYVRVASGMAYNNDTFIRLVKDILEGKFRGGYILCTHPDRILRFSLSLFETICSHGGCEIICISESDDKGETESLADDVLAVICHFSAKKYGARAKESCELTLTADCIKRMGELKKQNLPNKAIWESIVAEGWLNNHGEKPSYFTCCKYLRSGHNFDTAVGIMEGDVGLGLFKEFLKKQCQRKPEGRMALAELCKAYDSYCIANGKATSPRWLIGQHLSALQVKRIKSNGSRYACGIVLKGSKLAS